MRQTADGLQQATELVNLSGEALRGIVAAVGDCSSRIRAIALAAKEQATASGKINCSLEEIDAVTVETEASVAQTGQAVCKLREQDQHLNGLILDFKRQEGREPRALAA